MADQPTSRRSFLFGRSLRQEDPWLRFLARLKRSCEGTLSLLKRDSGVALARLVPVRFEDVLHARALCQEYGVCMALDGVPLSGADQQRPVLLVEAGQAWASATVSSPGLWRVEAGCPLAVLQAHGLVLDAVPTRGPVQNFAQWLALLQVGAAVGALGDYGVQAIECLYPDGSIEVLGQFGVQDSQPLRSLAAQRAVPALFQLTMDARLQSLRQQCPAGQWPLRYRLDALLSDTGVAVNLAHLLLGHRGSLGWVVAAQMRMPSVRRDGHVGATALPDAPVWCQQRRDLDRAVKQAMDPQGVYMSTAD